MRGLAFELALVPACVAALLGGCDNGNASASKPVARSEAVRSTAPDTPTATTPPSSAAAHPVAPAGPHKLCDDAIASTRVLPKTPLAHAEAPGAPALDDKLPVGDGKWTWINFFAAWCGPCKEEIPRLRSWDKNLAAAGTPIHLVFVSVDDDDRQLAKFLDAQPADTGVRSALWLKGNGRDAWFAAMKMKNPPDLPEHALVDPAGKVRCLVEGAVEDSDFAQLSSLVRGR